MDKLMRLSGFAECFLSPHPTMRSPYMPGYCTTWSAVAKSRRTYAQPYCLGSRPLKLSQLVPRADLMPKFVHTNIARHAYRRCTLPFYLCQPVTFSWPLLRADTSVVRWCPHAPTELHTHTHAHAYSEPAFENSLHLSLSLSLAPGSKKKNVWFLYKYAVTLCHCTLGERERQTVCALCEWSPVMQSVLLWCDLMQIWVNTHGQEAVPAIWPVWSSY